MLVFRLAVALISSAAAAPKSPLLARLNLRTCEDAFSPVREQVLRAWFASHAGHVSMHVNGGRDLNDEAGGRRAFSVDETLERLANNPPARLDASRSRCSGGNSNWVRRAGRQSPEGLVPTLLGDRLRIDVGESAAGRRIRRRHPLGAARRPRCRHPPARPDQTRFTGAAAWPGSRCA